MLLQDEIPKFGSGMRMITVESVTPTWVRLTCGGKRAKIPKDKWLDMLARHNAFRKRSEKRT